MRRKLVRRFTFLLAVFMVTAGYANIEGIIWGFRYQSYWLTVDHFDLGLPPLLNHIPQWIAFEIFAVLPFGIGLLLIGYLLRDLR